jgi:hypothetical protein
MADDLKDPQAVQVSTTISFHEALNAVAIFVQKYPEERIDITQIRMLEGAVDTLMERYREHCRLESRKQRVFKWAKRRRR